MNLSMKKMWDSCISQLFHLVLYGLLFLSLHCQVILSISFKLSSSPPPNKTCSDRERYTLLLFKSSISVDNSSTSHCPENLYYPKMETWKEDSDCSSWDGVHCDGLTGHVIGIDLSYSGLRGTTDAMTFLFLQHLQELNLACNDFYGSKISSNFGQFMKLRHLNLSSSNFSGLLPIEISHLSKLVSLDLSGSSCEFNLKDLELRQDSFNKILQNLTELRFLHLDCLDMSSVAPSSLLNLSSSLISLSLSRTNLQGTFPNDVFRLPFLQQVRMSGNGALTGNLPKSNWSGPIRLLDLSSTNFSGELPITIGNLKFLEVLCLAHSNFKGSIPTSFGNLTRIVSLDLISNKFTGRIPTSISNLWKLNSLNLKDNNFSGVFPDVFGNVSQLTVLSLSNNSFSGQIPSSAFSLKRLSELDFSRNKFEGQIPWHVCGLSNLAKFDLAYNFLSGRLPFWLFTLPSLQVLCLNNNKLKGPIPNFMFEFVNLTLFDLSSNNLTGTFTSETLSNLKTVEHFDVSYNAQLSLATIHNTNFTLPKLRIFKFFSCDLSEFPIFLRNSKNLKHLDLSDNRIPGRISRWQLELCQNLAYLNLSYNFFTSFEPIPSLISLTYLDLQSNLLQGELPVLPTSIWFFRASNNNFVGKIPLSFCNLSFITYLILSNNGLSGIIPQCLGSSSDWLFFLNLGMNYFHGSIPQSLAKTSIQFLNLNGNQLEGPLPLSFVNCSQLHVLNIGNNKIYDTFPHSLAPLPELYVLILRSNRFHGPIGHSNTTFSFPELRILDLSNNRFNGHLPTRFFDSFQAMMQSSLGDVKYLSDQLTGYYSLILVIKGFKIEVVRVLSILTAIDLSDNLFEGEIPGELGKLNSLRLLNFSHNMLTGHIPSSLGNLEVLESLDLSSNKLIGQIPMELNRLSLLEVINLSYNQLVGPIPHTHQFETFPNGSYVGNLGLCGFPLTKECGYDKAQEHEIGPTTFYEEDDTSSWFDWKFAMMGCGCGLAAGLSIGYIVFTVRKPQWFVRTVDRKQLTNGGMV